MHLATTERAPRRDFVTRMLVACSLMVPLMVPATASPAPTVGAPAQAAETARSRELARASKLARTGHHEEAEAVYRELVDQSPDAASRAAVQLELARLLALAEQPGRASEAEELFVAAARGLPEPLRFKAENAYGVFLLRQSRAEDAQRLLRSAVARADERGADGGGADEGGADEAQRARLVHNLAGAVRQAGRESEAFGLYQQALQLDPHFSGARRAIEEMIEEAPRAERWSRGSSTVEVLLDAGDLVGAAAYLHSALRGATDRGGGPFAADDDLPALLARLLSADSVGPEEFRQRWLEDIDAATGGLTLTDRSRDRLRQIRWAYVEELPVVLDPCEARERTTPWQEPLEERVVVFCNGDRRHLATRLEVVFSSLLRAIGDGYARRGDVASALGRWAVAWSAGDSYEAATYLTGALLQAREELDADGTILRRAVSTIFDLKGAAYRSRDWERILPFHTLLGEIFQAQRRWGDSNSPSSAIFQWEHALAANRQLASESGRRPLPTVHSKLGFAYQAVGRERDAALRYLHAAEEYLGLERPAAADVQLRRIDDLDSPDLSAQRRLQIERLREVAGRQLKEERARLGNADAALALEVQGKLAADPQFDTEWVHVESTDGVVRLTGTVARPAAIEEIRRLVLTTEGVKELMVDELRAPAPDPR